MEQLNELILQTRMLLSQCRHEALKEYYNAVLEALERLQKIEKTPKKKPEKEATPGRFQEFVTAYFDFHTIVAGVKPMWSAAQGKAMKEIITYLIDNTPNKDEDGALVAWQWILSHWDRLSNFLKNQLTIHSMKRNLPEIIATLKNGHSAQQKNESNAAKFKQRYRGNSGTDNQGNQRH